MGHDAWVTREQSYFCPECSEGYDGEKCSLCGYTDDDDFMEPLNNSIDDDADDDLPW